jgi:acyl-CoA dehydrogenase
MEFRIILSDSGNMELLIKYGNQFQKEKYLKPLLNGEIRSCFAMTEPNNSSSDPTNLETNIINHKTHYLVNGRKWFITGAVNFLIKFNKGDKRCKFVILMGRTPNKQAN